MRNLIFIPLLCLIGCGAVPWNAQNYAGVTHVSMKGCKQDEGNPTQAFCDIQVYDGKEKSDVKVKVAKDAVTGNFTAEYSAKDVRAFDGQALRAEVEKAVAEEVKNVLPQIVESAVKAIVKP